jgi:hypothetical protein
MRLALVLPIFLLASCAQLRKRESPESVESPVADDLVTVNTALAQARSSYLLGCVIAHKEMRPQETSFNHCLEKARLHHEELMKLMEQKPLEITE